VIESMEGRNGSAFAILVTFFDGNSESQG